MIREPNSSIGETHSLHAVIGKKLSIWSVYALKNDCTELAFSRVIFSHFTCAIPKEVLFCVLD